MRFQLPSAAAAGLISFLVAAPVWAGGALSPQEEIDAVNEAIRLLRANWVAGATTMTALPPGVRRKRLRAGRNAALHPPSLMVTPNGNGGMTTEPIPVAAVTAIPRKLDYRDFNGQSYVTPVKDQGSCGGSVAFAETAGLESYLMLRGQVGPTMPVLSPRGLISWGVDSCPNGGRPDTVADFIVRRGLPSESGSPLADAKWSVGSSDPGSRGWSYGPHPLGYTGVPRNVAAIKEALAAYGPVETVFKVYEDFYSYTSGVYMHVWGPLEGAHSVLIVGYDDAQAAFIVKNSWGSLWGGENGFFKIAYSEAYSETEFGSETLAYLPALGPNALFIGMRDPPRSMAPGEVAQVAITLQNDGTTAWTSTGGYELGAWSSKDNTHWGFNRVPLDPGEVITPGATKTFDFGITAPDTPGVQWAFQWKMVQKDAAWFGQVSPFVGVRIVPDSEPPEASGGGQAASGKLVR